MSDEATLAHLTSGIQDIFPNESQSLLSYCSTLPKLFIIVGLYSGPKLGIRCITVVQLKTPRFVRPITFAGPVGRCWVSPKSE
jgi:hypothetical protein